MKGQEFKSIRERLGLTQLELSKVLCLSGKQAVGNIETDFRKPGRLLVVIMRYLESLSERKVREFCEDLSSIRETEFGDKRGKS